MLNISNYVILKILTGSKLTIRILILQYIFKENYLLKINAFLAILVCASIIYNSIFYKLLETTNNKQIY